MSKSTALTKITTRAKQIRKAHPRMEWKSAVKQAGAEYRKGAKVGAVKKKRKIHQNGTSVKRFDVQRAAKAPGKRKSATKKTYYEYRKNRSDMPGKLTGIPESKLIGAVKEKLKASLGEAYVKRDMATRKADKKKYQKIISETKRKIVRISK